MSRFKGQRIVAPIDFSDEADRAVDFALDLAKSPKYVTAVHVAPPLNSFEPGVVWDAVNDTTREESLREAFHRRYAAPKYRDVHFVVRFGDPGREIADFAKESSAALIIMPSHGRTGLAHLLIGSVAERVVRLAQCPVLVLRGLPS